LRRVENSVVISARTGYGLETLIDRITVSLSNLMTEVELLIPPHKQKLLNLVYSEGTVVHREDRAEGVFLEARVPHRTKAILASELGINLEEVCYEN
jgi:GTP-binding protein HflX